MHKRYLTASLAGLAVVASALLSAGMSAGAASAATSSGCPAANALGNLQAASNVSASFANGSGADKTATTYTFSSLANENRSGGVPGLIKYCVYPSAPQNTAAVDHALVGANKAHWVAATGSGNFAFARPGGDPSNIPLDGTHGITMGTATWSNGFPASQSILLHINDPTVCSGLYGSGTLTCFVKPSTGPVCDHGDTVAQGAAYNSMPFDVANCHAAGIGFEATSTNEFGDRVTLASGTPTTPASISLRVDFQDFACQSGHWDANPAPCAVTDPSNPTWQLPITANLYDPNGSGGLTTPIATSGPVLQSIPYRPAADPVNCPGADANKWFNPKGPGGGVCQNSIGTVLTFNFPAGTTLPASGDVVWTVAFNTSTSGYNPLHVACLAGSFPGLGDGGCPYDSLNVGDQDYSGAPYAGIDPNEAESYSSQGSGPLQSNTTNPGAGYRPLGEIITN